MCSRKSKEVSAAAGIEQRREAITESSFARILAWMMVASEKSCDSRNTLKIKPTGHIEMRRVKGIEELKVTPELLAGATRRRQQHLQVQ